MKHEIISVIIVLLVMLLVVIMFLVVVVFLVIIVLVSDCRKVDQFSFSSYR